MSVVRLSMERSGTKDRKNLFGDANSSIETKNDSTKRIGHLGDNGWRSAKLPAVTVMLVEFMQFTQKLPRFREDSNGVASLPGHILFFQATSLGRWS